MLIFRQLFDPPSSTYTYLLADERSGAAVMIDPVFEQVRRDAALIEELGLRLAYALETHVHADHVTGAWLLKQRTGCRIALSANSGAEGADRYLVQDDVVAFGGRNLQVRQTPGHTGGCLTYVLDDRSMAFTGDCLFVRGTGRTDFQEGDPHAMYRSIHQQIFTLPDACLLYPAHDHRGLTADPGWAALRYSFAGIWEIDPHGLEEHAAAVQILDVREPQEFVGPLGHIRGAILIPLGELADRVGDLARDRPIVAVCRAGSRSAQATVILREAGFADVANLAGGMLRWRAEGHAVEGGSA